MQVTRGAEGLRELLREQAFDVRALDPTGFRAWLARLLGRWGTDPTFRQRATIRDLRRAHPDLRRIEQTHRAAAGADAATPTGARLREVERAAADARKAVAGLAAALARAADEDRPRLSAKWEDYRRRLRALDEELTDLRGSPEREALRAAEAALRRAREAAGLDRAEAELAALLAARGRQAGRVGESFEDTAAAAIGREVVPEVAAGGVRVVRRVRLGTGAEFDALVVREPVAGGAAEVLAAVEAKRDVNGIVHGFLRRQADLAWLTGDVGRYDPAAHRTRAFPAGHFDRAVAAGGVRLGPGSFARFRRDAAAGWFLDGLYLATRAGPMWGLSPAALARVAAWVATDEQFDPNAPDYLARLYRRCLALAGPVEAPDVLRLYATSETRARQVLLVDDALPWDSMG